MLGLNPKKMQAVMKQMGISQQEISAERVIIEKTDGSKIIITNPSVSKIKMKEDTSFQIQGQETQEEPELNTTEDIQTIIKKTSCSEEEAKKALEETGDLAEAILKLS